MKSVSHHSVFETTVENMSKLNHLLNEATIENMGKIDHMHPLRNDYITATMKITIQPCTNFMVYTAYHIKILYVTEP